MFRKVLKNTGVLSAGVFVSRVLGLLRDILIARYFGTSSVLEAYIVAFRLPNMFRSLLGEGFSDSVATPVLSEYRKDASRLDVLGNRLFSVMLIVLTAGTLMGIVCARPMVALIAPGFLQDPEKFALTVSFVRITFFYFFFIGMVSVLTSLLYVRKRFAMAAFVPALLNVCLICGILFFRKYLHDYVLVASVFVAGLAQFLSLYIYTRLKGVSLSVDIRNAFGDRDIRRMGGLFIARIWASIVYHLNVFIDTVYASLGWIVGQGAMAAVYYSNRIIQFPLALVALSISRVAIVDLSGLHKEEKYDEFKQLLVFSFQNVFFFIIPVVCVFLAMSREIVDVLFVRGSFDLSALSLTAPVLFCYSLGLLFFCGIKLLVNTFYALKDTVTPARTATVSLLLNAVLSAALMFPLKVSGVALASSIAAGMNFFLLYRALCRRIGTIPWGAFAQEVLRLCAVGCCVALVCKGCWLLPYGSKYVRLFISIAAALGAFIVLCDVLGVSSYRYYKQWILKKK